MLLRLCPRRGVPEHRRLRTGRGAVSSFQLIAKAGIPGRFPGAVDYDPFRLNEGIGKLPFATLPESWRA